MRISDWSSDVCSSDLPLAGPVRCSAVLRQSNARASQEGSASPRRRRALGFTQSGASVKSSCITRGRSWRWIEDAASCIAAELAKWKKWAKSLQAVADNVRQRREIFVRTGPAMMTPEETAEYVAQIIRLVEKYDERADAALVGEATYAQFEAIKLELQGLELLADEELVSEVARAFHQFGG